MTKVNYLETIGIQIWRAKKSLPGAKITLNYDCYRLTRNNILMGFLFMDRVPLSQQSPKLVTLTTAILDAINLQAEKITSFDLSQIKEDELILIFGLDLAHYFKTIIPATCNLIATFHPLQLLRDSNLKAEVWQAIKKLKNE